MRTTLSRPASPRIENENVEVAIGAKRFHDPQDENAQPFTTMIFPWMIPDATNEQAYHCKIVSILRARDDIHGRDNQIMICRTWNPSATMTTVCVPRYYVTPMLLALWGSSIVRRPLCAAITEMCDISGTLSHKSVGAISHVVGICILKI